VGHIAYGALIMPCSTLLLDSSVTL